MEEWLCRLETWLENRLERWRKHRNVRVEEYTPPLTKEEITRRRAIGKIKERIEQGRYFWSQGEESRARESINKPLNKAGWTPLMAAVFYGDEKLVGFILTLNPKLNAQNNKGQTALMIAAHRGNEMMVYKLLMATADVDLKDEKGRTVLQYAKKRPDVSELLNEWIQTGEDFQEAQERENAIRPRSQQPQKTVPAPSSPSSPFALVGPKGVLVQFNPSPTK